MGKCPDVMSFHKQWRQIRNIASKSSLFFYPHWVKYCKSEHQPCVFPQAYFLCLLCMFICDFAVRKLSWVTFSHGTIQFDLTPRYMLTILYFSHFIHKINRWHVCSGHVRTAKALIRLCICTVWSGPTLSVYRITLYWRIYQSTIKALVLRGIAGWSGPFIFACAMKASFLWFIWKAK